MFTISIQESSRNLALHASTERQRSWYQQPRNGVVVRGFGPGSGFAYRAVATASSGLETISGPHSPGQTKGAVARPPAAGHLCVRHRVGHESRESSLPGRLVEGYTLRRLRRRQLMPLRAIKPRLKILRRPWHRMSLIPFSTGDWRKATPSS